MRTMASISTATTFTVDRISVTGGGWPAHGAVSEIVRETSPQLAVLGIERGGERYLGNHPAHEKCQDR
jgi:hypothetical protein